MKDLDLPVLSPVFQGNSVPVVFATDKNYSIYLGVCIKSLIAHTSPNTNYDIIILEDHIPENHKTAILSMQQPNVSIRIVDVSSAVNLYNKDIFYIRDYFTISIYYRFFLPQIMKEYDKIIYLDCDMIILKDVKELYETELANTSLAAVRELYIPFEIKFDKTALSYYQDTLHIFEPRDYFNSGCLIMNLKKMRRQNITEKFITCLAKLDKPKQPDQDVMNSVLYKDVTFLDPRWNTLNHIIISIPDYKKAYSASDIKTIELADSDPFILHFSGHIKPWSLPYSRHAEQFWKYARQTGFFKEVLYNKPLTFLINQN